MKPQIDLVSTNQNVAYLFISKSTETETEDRDVTNSDRLLLEERSNERRTLTGPPLMRLGRC